MSWNDPRTRRRLKAALWTGVAVTLFVLSIEDWGRDFLRWDAEQVWRPVDREAAGTLNQPPGSPYYTSNDELADAVRWAAARIRNWKYVGAVEDDGTTILSFVRTNRLLRLRDDVTVFIEDTDGARVIRATSTGRLHLADLGRNPRNLRRLYLELEDVVIGSNLIPMARNL